MTTHLDNQAPPLSITHLQAFFERFNVHPDRYAVQTPEGSYLSKIDAPTPVHFLHHLQGNWTLAVYAARERPGEMPDVSKWICLDSDEEDGFRLLQAVQYALGQAHNWDSLLESSRRGGHLWIFLAPDSWDRSQALKLLRAICEVYYYRGRLDVFPKPGGMGGNVRLPLGIHRKTNQRYPVWDHRNRQFIEGVPEALEYIASLGTVSTAQIIARYGR